MDILDIFYNYIVKEATDGRVNCFFYYNVMFNTYLNDSVNFIKGDKTYEDVYVPCLNIKDKDLFDKLLIEYVNLALDFYDDSNFPLEVIEKLEFDEYRVCKEKMIMTNLLSDAIVEDFNDPIRFGIL